MFDLTSGKLLLLGIVALIVLGPKDFPVLLRTIGKYMGIIKRQADEFREQFNDAMRESELDQLKKEVEGLGQQAESSLRETEHSISQSFDGARADLDVHLDDPLKPSPHTTGYTPEELREPPPAETQTASDPLAPDPDVHDANGIPMAPAGEPAPDRERTVAQPDRASMNGSGSHSEHTTAATETSPKSGA